MICLTVRPLLTLLFCGAIAAPLLPASAQLTPLSAAPQPPPRAAMVTSRSYGVPLSPNGTSGYWRGAPSRPNAPNASYQGTSGFGNSPGVPLGPGFGGNVAPQPGFGYQPGVTLGPGFGGSSLQALNQNGQPNGVQGQRYGTDGLPVLPTLPGYSMNATAANGYYGGGQGAANCPPLLGGYYFSNYTAASVNGYTLPTIYNLYGSFPGYFYVGDSVSVTILPSAPAVSYDSGYLPYDGPAYQVNNQYNTTVNNYYASPSGDAATPETPRLGATAPVPAAGYDAAFADIQKAWLTGNIDLLKKHLRQNDVKIAVSIKGAYSYSIASGDFVTVTKDAFDKLTTTAFEFTSVRKQTNGDITGYARHMYLAADGTDGAKKTIYLSFTLTKRGEQWYITSIDTSMTQMDPQSVS